METAAEKESRLRVASQPRARRVDPLLMMTAALASILACFAAVMMI